MLLLLIACALVSDSDLADRMDLDGDGVPRPDDCDDEDATVLGRASYFGDADADGFGGGAATVACSGPEGYVLDGTDCDDTDPLVNGASAERCDDLDNNCDGLIDEDSAVDALSWFADRDGDSYGDASELVVTCYQPDGYLLDGADCDDGDPAISPAATEVCDGASVDEDCSGAPDLDCDEDGHDDVQLGGDDCNDADASVNPSARETCGDAVDDDCDGVVGGSCTFSGAYSLEDAPAHIDGVPGRTAAGWTLDVADLTGDTLDDVVIGGFGGVAIMAGPVTESATLADARTYIYDDVGFTVNRVASGDLDGDGESDLLVATSAGTGTVGLFYGGVPAGDASLSDADASWAGAVAQSLGTRIVSGADLDGDGIDDAALSMYKSSGSGDSVELLYGGSRGDVAIGNSIDVNGGVAQLAMGGDIDADGVSDLLIASSQSLWVLLDASSATSTGDADAVVNEYDGSWVASGLAFAGDLNSDGYDDIIECTAHYLGVGISPIVHVLHGPITGDHDFSVAAATFTLQDDAQTCPVSAGGDLDGNGTHDIVVGASEIGLTGAAYVLLTPLAGALDVSDADAALSGGADNNIAGYAVHSGGDVSGDGYDDALISDPCTPATASCPDDDLGRVYLLFGGE